MSMTKSQAMKIAHLVKEIRTDWDFAGIMAALQKAPEGSALAAIAIAMCTAAEDPGAQTPVAFINRVYWPSWSVSAGQERDDRRMAELERQRSRRVLAELYQDARKAAPRSRVREILAGTPWAPKDARKEHA